MMQLVQFHVQKFRNIVNSTPVDVESDVTCLVGKNEAGKSALLEALYLFNPAYDHTFVVDDQYPRWLLASDRRSGDPSKQAPISVTLQLGDTDRDLVERILGPGVLTSDEIVVWRRYNGRRSWKIGIDERAATEHLRGRLPSPVQGVVANAVTVEALRESLDGMAVADPEDVGGGPTAEDIEAAKAILRECGLDDKSPHNRAANLLAERLPRFFWFTQYHTLPGRLDFRELAASGDQGPGQTGIQTARALLELAETDLSKLADEEYELRRTELEAVQIELSRQVFEYWRQNQELEVLIDVDKETQTDAQGQHAVARYLDIRLRDRRTGYSNNFEQRSSGFQWFFSFLAAFSEFENDHRPMIVLLDEPALALHGRAQADFLRFINERLAPSAPVLYTTHSPFMVEADRLDRVRLVEDRGPDEGAVATADVLASDPDSLFPLQAALGYDIAQHLFVGPHNLLVEGTSDYLYLTMISQLLEDVDREHLDPRWRVLPAGGATNIPTFVALIGPHLDVTVLADSNTRGMQRVTGMVDRGLLEGRRLILAADATDDPDGKADIEDLFTEGDYLKLYNAAFGTNVKVGDLPDGTRITERIQRFTDDDFDHRAPAEFLLRNHHKLDLAETTRSRFEHLIRLINATLDE